MERRAAASPDVAWLSHLRPHRVGLASFPKLHLTTFYSFSDLCTVSKPIFAVMAEILSILGSAGNVVISLGTVIRFVEDLHKAPRAARNLADEARALRDAIETFRISLQSRGARFSEQHRDVAQRVLQSAQKTTHSLQRRATGSSRRRALNPRTSWVLSGTETMAFCNSLRSFTQMIYSLQNGANA